LGRYVLFVDCCQIFLKFSPLANNEAVIRDTLPVNLDVEHNAEAEVDNLEFASKANDEGRSLSLGDEENR
jgi:hypothetical protein